MRAILGRIVDFFSSLGLAAVLLVLLGLLTWLGTLEQVHTGLFEVQKKYFESFFLVHQAGPIAIPLPGANLVMCLLAVNLVVGGLVRIRKGWSMAGILVTHVGILMLLLSAFVKMYHSEDGHLTLYEGERSNAFQSYYRWEIAIARELPDGRLEEHLVPIEQFSDATGPKPVTLTSPDLPFDLEVSHYMANCRPGQKGPMFEVSVPVVDGVFLDVQPLMAQAEANSAGIYATVVDKSDRSPTEGVLWGRQTYPWTVDVGGESWAIDLRKERYPMPFTIVLDDFTKEDHPGTGMPRHFSSDVTVIEDGSSRPIRIQMNEPLRDEGLVLFQASWGPSTARPGDPLFSTLSVVRNPADQYPLYACFVIAIGLILHFGRRLTKYIRSETRRS